MRAGLECVVAAFVAIGATLVGRMHFDVSTSTLVGTALALFAYYVYALLCPPVDNGSHDEKTTSMLRDEPQPPAPCAPIVNALNAAEVTEDEAACVDTMRNIVKVETTLGFKRNIVTLN
jgi:hypothetical protein